MKLNMWMVVNRLSKYDIEYHISHSTDRILSCALPVYASGCLYIYGKGSDIVCSSAQGELLIRNISTDEGLLLMQSIFNWYGDWENHIIDALKEKDYSRLAHHLARAFRNPVMIQNSNYILRGIDLCGVDAERIPDWKYILDNGQSSLSMYQSMVEALVGADRLATYKNGVCRFDASKKRRLNGEELPLRGLHAFYSYGGMDYGRIMVLDALTPLNPGDIAVLEYLSEQMALYAAASDNTVVPASVQNILLRLLENGRISESEGAYFTSMICGNPDNLEDSENWLSLLCIRFVEGGNDDALEMLGNCFLNHFPLIYYKIYHGDLVAVLWEKDAVQTTEQIAAAMDHCGYQGKLAYGLSLPVKSIQEFPCCYEQAVYAIEQCKEPGLCYFFTYASVYLLTEQDNLHRLIACDPYCRVLWNGGAEKRESLKTLAVYLREERATGVAADQLYIHKNTLNYRIKYLKQYAGWNLSDATVRDYLRLSLFFLEYLE